MSELVLVVLDRDDAQELRDGATWYPDLLDDTHPAIEALDAALDRDPEALARHGRGDFFGDQGGGEQDHSCHAECECPAGYGNHVSDPTPENKSGITADLIDRAVDEALTAMWGDGYEGVEDDVREAIWAAAPLLVEHGRRQAKTRWETRIEAAEALAVAAEWAGHNIAYAAPVIAAWAREQERARIKSLIEARAKEAADDYHLDPQAYHRGREDELVMLVEEIEPAGAREDGNGE